MDNIQNFQVLWFLLIFALFLGYALLDGFDLGIAVLLPLLGKSKEEKDTLIASIGPVWDGNEVWLITGGGALFAAFPHAYATIFSGFYPAMMLVLLALIFRAVSMEFRAYDTVRAGLWEKAFAGGSALAALLFGVALGNVVYGVPLDGRMEFTGNFFTLLRPVPLLFGITGLAAVLLQGAAWSILKTTGDLQQRSFQAIRILSMINVVLAVVYFAVLLNVTPRSSGNPLFFIGLLLTFSGLAALFLGVGKKKDGAAIWASSCSLIGLLLAAGAVQFPNLVTASNQAHESLTIYNSSSGLYSLQVMAAIGLVGMPVVVGYTIFVYRLFKGKTEAGNHY
ncbi:MAG: cytochrome d ubiquinol oxidase subunit II [Syntrophaceae bacterium]|jgi:cytochrome bd ubiquinol oxidase subunit II|nr:cytochrome d ubiquinol oxidase subunit II [Syntrophaceae bacterium]HOC59188.1 cytochrome d ubiquinol oxidase subunit II [Smithellaceae bacterium]HQM46029.1 cytochrome d ubiquinol oxidase subunit II [Smithellaceae bacterium]